MFPTVDVIDWPAACAEARAIRIRVFVQEQGVPPALEMDDMDALSDHAVARLPDGRAIATGRLLPDGHIGRMAVLPEQRGTGIGRAVLTALMERARTRGMLEVVLSAQTHAVGFYAKSGFIAQGDVYMEAGIPHVEMRRTL